MCQILKDVNLYGKQIYSWNFINIDHEHRLYYKELIETEEGEALDKGTIFGFDFIALSDLGNEGFDIDKSLIDVLYHGTAYFDGVRHLHAGNDFTNDVGYFNYPDLDVHIKILTEIKKLEDKYCE